jgi:hypothetical protein
MTPATWTSLLAFLLAGGAHAAPSAQANAYAHMAPLQQYLIADRAAEVALARGAAPKSISGEAKVLVLGTAGYETAIAGSNGFTCLVERAWMSPFDNPEFWNPKTRGPICYNPAATRSVLPYTLYRTNLVLMGMTEPQLLEQIRSAVAQKRLIAPETGSMSYMMSKHGYLSDAGRAWHSHLMFHIPKTDAATWGANLPGSPVVADTDHTQVPEPQIVFMVPLDHWSDGSAASLGDHHGAQE